MAPGETPDEGARNLSYNATLVLQALASGCDYGLEVIRITGLSSGTVHPVLRRLEAGKLVRTCWEDEDEAREAGRPARRYHRLTGQGQTALERARERLLAMQRKLGFEGGATG